MLTITPYVFAFFIIIAFSQQVIVGGDIWIRLTSGRYVLEEHAIPRSDPFSFTAYGHAWIDHEWIMGVAMYLMYRVHYEVIVVVFALLAIAPFALMHRHVLKAHNSPWLPTLGLVAVAIVSAWRTYPPRPALINPIFFALLLILIDQRRNTALGEGSKRVWLAVPLMFVWANTQAGFMAGFGVLAVWAAICFFEKRDLLLALAVSVASISVGLVNAYGFRLYTYTLWASIGGSADRRFVQEWLSPDFHTPLNWPYAFALLVALRFTGRRMDPFRQIMLIGTIMASLLSRRFQPFFAVALILGVAPLLPQMRPLSRRHLRLLSYAVTPLFAIPAALFAITVPDGSPSSAQPHMALAFVRERYPDEHVFARIDVSSWMTYEGEPVFFDARTSQVYSNQLVEEYFDLEAARGDWEGTLDKYGINVMLVDADTPLAPALERRRWHNVLVDGDTILFVRPDSAADERSD